MRLEELLKNMLLSFFVITTGVIVSMCVMCLIFDPDATFPVETFGIILLTALVCDLPFFIFYSRKELGKKQMLVRTIIHFFVLLAILLFLSQLWNWVDLNNPKEIVVFILLVSAVYAIVRVTTAYHDKKLAIKLNESLKQRYHS